MKIVSKITNNFKTVNKNSKICKPNIILSLYLQHSTPSNTINLTYARFVCSFCHQKFDQQPQLISHLATHITLPKQPSQDDLRRGHLQTTTRFLCLSCGKSFFKEEQLLSHIKVEIYFSYDFTLTRKYFFMILT